MCVDRRICDFFFQKLKLRGLQDVLWFRPISTKFYMNQPKTEIDLNKTQIAKPKHEPKFEFLSLRRMHPHVIQNYFFFVFLWTNFMKKEIWRFFFFSKKPIFSWGCYTKFSFSVKINATQFVVLIEMYANYERLEK